MIQAIKKAYPILDEKGRPCTFPTFASQVYMEDGTSVESAIQDVILNNNNTDDAAKLGGKAPEYYLQPRNLLDNSDFRNPVNQRGYVNGTSLAFDKYFIDRWKANLDSMTATISKDGISVSNESSIRQILDKIYTDIYLGKAITLAVKSSDEEYAVCSAVLTNPGTYTTLASAGVFGWFALDISTDGHINVVLKPSSGKVVEWAALYEGEYTADTLPPYVPKGYGAELAECQRYFLTGVGAHTVGHSGVMTSKEFYINISTPSVMRTTPTVTLDVADNVVFGTTSGYAVCNVTDIKSVGKQSNGIFIILGLASEPPQHYAAGSTFGTLLTLSADL